MVLDIHPTPQSQYEAVSCERRLVLELTWNLVWFVLLTPLFVAFARAAAHPIRPSHPVRPSLPVCLSVFETRCSNFVRAIDLVTTMSASLRLGISRSPRPAFLLTTTRILVAIWLSLSLFLAQEIH